MNPHAKRLELLEKTLRAAGKDGWAAVCEAARHEIDRLENKPDQKDTVPEGPL